MKAFP